MPDKSKPPANQLLIVFAVACAIWALVAVLGWAYFTLIATPCPVRLWP